MAGRILIVGAGVFGVTAAIVLRRRGWDVTLADAGPVPHPLAASTDLSKAVRVDYGADAFYTDLAERSLAGWRAWNTTWGEPLFHEDGWLFLTREPLAAREYEPASLELLSGRGYDLPRIDAAALAEHHGQWAPGLHVDGYFNPRGGWAESGAVIERLVDDAREVGVSLRAGAAVTRWLVEPAAGDAMDAGGRSERDDVPTGPDSQGTSGGARGGGAVQRASRDVPAGAALPRGRIRGAVLGEDERHDVDVVLVSAGAWTAKLLPHLAPILSAVGQPVFHLRPARPDAFSAPRFRPWAADVTRTGWYGFPLLRDGTVKLAHHGPGRVVDPDEPREVTPEEEARCREFLAEALPGLADAPLDRTRLCLYCDTVDGDLWIDQDPDRPGLVVAAGGSGHAFKFAPVLGDIVADVVERRPSDTAARFAWRTPSGVGDAARVRGD